MSDNANKGWTDRQRLAYYFNLVEHSNVKLDFANAPRPEGKSVGACRIMVDRLKGTLKPELEALRAGNPIEGGSATPKKAAVSTPRKRKAKNEGEGEATPSKRGRKKKSEVEVLADDDEGDEGDVGVGVGIKPEPKEEEDDIDAET